MSKLELSFSLDDEVSKVYQILLGYSKDKKKLTLKQSESVNSSIKKILETKELGNLFFPFSEELEEFDLLKFIGESPDEFYCNLIALKREFSKKSKPISYYGIFEIVKFRGEISIYLTTEVCPEVSLV